MVSLSIAGIWISGFLAGIALMAALENYAEREKKKQEEKPWRRIKNP